MASKLTEVLTPGETVLFHAYWTWWEIAVRVFYAIAIIPPLILGVGILIGRDIWLEEALIAAATVAVWLPWRMAGAEALVTDRRFLYRTGRRHVPVVELATDTIEDIVHITRPLGIRSHLWVKARGKAPVRVELVPGLRPLWAALAQQAGLPPPPISLGLRLAYHGINVFCLLTGFAVAGITAVMMVALMDDREPVAAAFLLAFVVAFFIPALVLGLAAGMILGFVLSAFAIRCFFTAAQAQQLAGMGYDRYDKGFENWGAERSVRASLRLFSWLYGQPMELDDD